MSYQTVVGLEIHIQVKTASKAFCPDPNDFNATPNRNISHISLAHPGSLPKMNLAHLDKAILLGLACKSTINHSNYFDRKNYFYPDLPKGYQITQDKLPYCKGGSIRYWSQSEEKTIRIHHIHMEEDAGKSIHDQLDSFSLVDYNRAGVPLLEIVTEPDFRSGQEVSDFMAELQKIVQYLDISDANMEEGSFRCDCNVSVMKKGAKILGERCEIKNMNSRKYAKNAIEYEAKRQINIIESGGTIQKTTMLYDPEKNITKPMRKKESENDYKYFPEPDLPPIYISNEMINQISKKCVSLPFERYKVFIEKYLLSESDAEILIENKAWSDAFIKLVENESEYKPYAELLIQKVIPYLRSEEKHLRDLGDVLMLKSFVQLLNTQKVSKSAAYQYVFPLWINDISQSPEQIATKLDLIKSEDQGFVDEIIDDVLHSFPDKVAEYRKGKKGLIGFFMGQVKIKSGSSADPITMQQKLAEKLK